MNTEFDDDLFDAKQHALTAEQPAEVLEPGLGHFDKWVFPAIRNMGVNTTTADLMGVQPLDGPVGQLLHLGIDWGTSPKPEDEYTWYDMDGRRIPKPIRFSTVHDSLLIEMPQKELMRSGYRQALEFAKRFNRRLDERLSEQISELFNDRYDAAALAAHYYRLIGVDHVGQPEAQVGS